MDKKIYFVTVFCFDKKLYVPLDVDVRNTLSVTFPIKSRTFGFFFEKERAIEAVSKNIGDIHETMYTYAVVEELHEGLYSLAELEDSVFFKWDQEKEQYCRIDSEPEEIAKELDRYGYFHQFVQF